MKKLYYKKILPIVVVLLFAILLGFLQCKVLAVKFEHMCNLENYYPDLYDFLSYILVGDNVGHIFYLEKNDMGLMFQPLSFLVFGLFIAGFNFLVKPRGYYQFVYARKEKEKTFVNGIFKEQLSLIFIYSIVYYASIFVCSYIYGYESTKLDKILTALLLGVVSKIVFFVVIKVILLYVFLRRGITDSILTGIILVVTILMFDVAVECKGINLLLFSSESNFLGMFVLVLLGTVIHCINRKIDLLKLD